MKTTVCGLITTSTNLNQWCEHYFNLGFDNIVLYRIKEGNIDYEYIKKRNVLIQINTNPDIHPYVYFYSQYVNTFDWCFFATTQDWLTLNKHKSIKELINDENLYDTDTTIILFPIQICNNGKPSKFGQVYNEKSDLIYTLYNSLVKTNFYYVSYPRSICFLGAPNMKVQLSNGKHISNPYCVYNERNDIAYVKQNIPNTDKEFNEIFINCANYEGNMDLQTLVVYYMNLYFRYKDWTPKLPDKKIKQFVKVARKLGFTNKEINKFKKTYVVTL